MSDPESIKIDGIVLLLMLTVIVFLLFFGLFVIELIFKLLIVVFSMFSTVSIELIERWFEL